MKQKGTKETKDKTERNPSCDSIDSSHKTQEVTGNSPMQPELSWRFNQTEQVKARFKICL